MLIYSSEPIRDLNNRLRIPTTSHYLDEYDIYEEVWLPVGDDKEADIYSLIEQQRLYRD
ncbi:MAG: hypothetical protein GXY40_06060 [Syntrophomonadaceae bacterium]|jgi:hypothetical protein|nr:hypothetical protein [Syntrophomonadaceae bacterium]